MDQHLSTSKSRIELKFQVLTDVQRRLAHLISQGKTDGDIAAELGITEGDLYPRIMDLYRALGVEGNNYAERRQGIKEMAYAFFADGSLPDDEEGPAVAISPAPVSQHIRLDNEEGPAVSKSSRSDIIEPLPDLEVLAERIGRLPDLKRRRLRIMAFSERGDRAKTAEKMGLSQSSLVPTMTPIYRQVGILANRHGYKELLQKAFLHLERHELVERIREDPESKHPARVPAPPAPVAAPTEPAQQEAMPALPSSPASFGAGVLIPIPPDATNVEVLSGEFTRDVPSAGLTAQLLERKRQGAKPAFLVLYPSLSDPSVTQGHVIFIEREKK